MGGKFLGLIFIGFLFGCNSTVTCDPTIQVVAIEGGSYQSKGCPTNHICDPSGICRQTCGDGSIGPCGVGLVCDQSIGKPQNQICQVDCKDNSEVCLKGEGCFIWTQPDSKIPSGAEPIVLHMCKKRCFTQITEPPPSFCVESNFFQCQEGNSVTVSGRVCVASDSN